MQDIHFNSLDLNLLRVFEALMEERSVTRAGRRLALSQSAVSHALNRLRYAFGDSLFLRTATGMQPTARALEIGSAVRTALSDLRTVLAPGAFDPASSRRGFSVAAGPYACAVLLPALVEHMRRDAPLAQLKIVSPDQKVVEALDSGAAACALGAYQAPPDRFVLEPLFQETLLWVARAGHPALGASLSLSDLAGLSQVAVSRSDDPPHGPAREIASGGDYGLRRRAAWEDSGVFEEALAARGLSRTIGVVAPDTFSALAIISRTDLVALLPRRLAELSIRAGRLAALDTPYVPPVIEIAMLRRRDREAEPGHAWLLGLIRRAATSVEAGEVQAGSV